MVRRRNVDPARLNRIVLARKQAGVVRGSLVLFRNHGGEPSIELVEDRSNPLGPLQSLGEAAPARVLP